MCGRYTLTCDADELVESFDVPDLTFEYWPRYNIAPSQLAPVLGEDARGRRVGLLRWGLVRTGSNRLRINARAESAERDPLLRRALRRRRCLVPADGFYEWAPGPRGATPYWIHPRAGGPISFAGIWDRGPDPGAEPGYGFAIITTEANDDVRAIHDRMPVVVAPADRDTWLRRDVPPDHVRTLLRPPLPGLLTSHAVSARVGQAALEEPGLVEPVSGG